MYKFYLGNTAQSDDLDPTIDNEEQALDFSDNK